MSTTTELTQNFILEHRSIKDCLKKGLINYSALSRLIIKELMLEKKHKKEAILIAARRFKSKIKTASQEDRIIELLKESNLDIKNNIFVFTIDKSVYPDSLIDIEKEIKKERELFFSIEGTKTITIIVQKENKEIIEKRFKNFIATRKENLSLITLTTDGIAGVFGAINYITGIFFENEVNIDELISCYDDTLIVINSKDLEKVMKFLHF